MLASLNSSHSAQIFFEGAQELLGPERLEQIAGDQALSSPSLQALQEFLQALESIYGVPGGRGLAFRIGQTAFKYVLRSSGQKIGLREKEFYFLPHQRRLETGLQILAGEIGRDWGQLITVSNSPTCWIVRVEQGDGPCGCKPKDTCCQALAGLLHAYMAWAGGGRYYRIVETECQASGDPTCAFQIEKKPLD